MRIAVGILIGIGFLAALVMATIEQMQVSCEVCIAFGGRQVCESAVAADSGQATMQATSSACARLSGGVTDGIRCNNTPPLSTRCSE